MKTFTSSTAVLALTTIASASPIYRKRQTSCIVPTVMNPNQAQVEASINSWNNDVNVVNNFLNTVGGINGTDALVSATMGALTNAQDEPCQLMTLASQPDFSDGPAAFTCAVQDLMNVFEVHVLDNLMNIIANPGDAAAVQSAVDDINQFRCCNVLPDASILWLDSADDNGISDQVSISAGRENACSAITCAPGCDALDNGNNGK